MADQTQRLEIATVRAEVGSNIVYRFANDAAAAAPIPTESGDIQNLKQVILEIQESAAEKISISTTIYPNVAAGLADTSDQEIFLVQSEDENEIYTVWKNESGTAVNTGKTALSATAIQTALDASSEAAQAAEEAADVATNRTAGLLSPSDTDPLTRDNGLPLQLGDRYFNTEFQVEYIYTDTGWQANDSMAALAELEANITTAPAADKIPRAQSDGKLNDDWLSAELARLKDLADQADPAKGAGLIGTRLNHPSLLALAIGRALTEKLYDIVNIRDFVTKTDIIDESNSAADWSPVFRRMFDWSKKQVEGKRRGVTCELGVGVFPMSQLETCNIAPTGTVSGTGMVGIRLVGAGDVQSVIVAKPGNTTGCIRLTSDRNTECFGVEDVAFLSDLAEDAATNNGIALQIDSSLGKGMPGYGDHPRWSAQVSNVFIGGYGATAGDLARRGNWDKGIFIQNKWYPTLHNIRCLGRYSVNLGARTACNYAIHVLGCYSPDTSNIYVQGNWDKGLWLEDNYNVSGGVEDFRVNNVFFVGPNHGFGMIHEYDSVDLGRLYEPGGVVNVIHANCYKAGITIKNHRQVQIDNLYGYAPRESRAQGELLPSVVLLDGVSDCKINGQFLEPGFYNSNSNAAVAVRIEGASEAIVVNAQFGHGGIGLLNNSTYTTRKSIFLRSEMPTSRRTSDWAQLVEYVDNAGSLTADSNSFGTTQDRRTLSSGKASGATYNMALRLLNDMVGQLYGGAFEISGKNSSGTVVNQVILRGRFVDAAGSVAGAENTAVGAFIQSSGVTQEAFRLQPPAADNDTYGYLLVRIAGAAVMKRVKVGPADSGGTGRRMLLVDN